MDVEMKSKNYTYFSERSYTGKDCKIDDKVVDYWKKVLGDNVFNNIEKVYNLRPEIVMSKKDFENVTESKEILQFSELFQTGFGENVKYQLKIGEKGAFVFDRFLDHFIKFGIAVLNEQEIDECIMDSYIDNIIRQISKISMGTLMFEMYICREQGLLVGNNSNEEYVYYNTHFLGDKKYINELFEIYPCLERMIFESIFYLVNNYKELLIRLKKDHDYLVEQLCDRKKFKKVVKMQSDISDSHKRGKTVSVLTLDNDVKVVYKPRSLKGEKAYQDFQTYISQGSKLKARTFKVIDCGNYGWEEFVESKPCSDMQQLRNYYYRFGELILQNYILNAMEESEVSMILDNNDFAYWNVTVERPLRLRVFPERTIPANTFKKADEYETVTTAIAKASATAPLDDWKAFAKVTKLKKAQLNKVRPFITEKDATAVATDEPDTDLRDTENIPFTYEGGIEAFMQNEVLTYAPDAYIDEKKTQIGYEISFTKYFYKPVELREMSEIIESLNSLEKEADGMMADIMGGIR